MDVNGASSIITILQGAWNAAANLSMAEHEILQARRRFKKFCERTASVQKHHLSLQTILNTNRSLVDEHLHVTVKGGTSTTKDTDDKLSYIEETLAEAEFLCGKFRDLLMGKPGRDSRAETANWGGDQIPFDRLASWIFKNKDIFAIYAASFEATSEILAELEPELRRSLDSMQKARAKQALARREARRKRNESIARSVGKYFLSRSSVEEKGGHHPERPAYRALVHHGAHDTAVTAHLKTDFLADKTTPLFVAGTMPPMASLDTILSVKAGV